MSEQYDVAVVGGGPAGLQAALTLGRMHHPTVLFDSGEYRNAPAQHLHNLAGADGLTPAEYRDRARRDLTAYDVTSRAERVERIREDGPGFVLSTGAGEVYADRVILATGMVDTLPDKPGVAELFGTAIAHCPYCHGHEYAEGAVAVLGPGPQLGHLPALLAPIARQVVALTDGATLDEELTARLIGLGTVIEDRPVAGFEARDHGAAVRFADGDELVVSGAFVMPAWSQRASFATQLGLELRETGAIAVDGFGRTSLPGVYAAGDLAQPPQLPGPVFSILQAAAAGQLAASAVDIDRLMPSGD